MSGRASYFWFPSGRVASGVAFFASQHRVFRRQLSAVNHAHKMIHCREVVRELPVWSGLYFGLQRTLAPVTEQTVTDSEQFAECFGFHTPNKSPEPTMTALWIYVRF
jgi:hypothetical protein